MVAIPVASPQDDNPADYHRSIQFCEEQKARLERKRRVGPDAFHRVIDEELSIINQRLALLRDAQARSQAAVPSVA